jgi:anti-sigma factor RsiW
MSTVNGSMSDEQMRHASECRKIAPMMGPLADGELDAASTVEVEEHLELCGACRERMMFAQAMKRSVKRACEVKMPDDARARMLRAMKAAALETEVRAPEAMASVVSLDDVPAYRARSSLRVAAWLMPIAAVFAFFIVPKVRHTERSGSLADIMAEHSRPLPPESSDPKTVRAFERYVGVPVRPLHLAGSKSRLVGGRVLGVQRERAAMLQYEIESQGGQPQRVSMFIYDPSKIRVDDADLEPRSVGSAEVRVGRANGYSVAVTQREGVGYLVASDLDSDTSVDLLVHAGDN